MSKWRRNYSKTKRWILNTLINRDGNDCYLCLEKIINKKDMTIDHLVAKSKGGSDDITNLRIAHEKCNQDKKNMSLEEFVSIQENF